MADVRKIDENKKIDKDIAKLRKLFDLCKEYDVASILYDGIDVTFYKVIPDIGEFDTPVIDVPDDGAVIDDEPTPVEDILNWADTSKNRDPYQ